MRPTGRTRPSLSHPMKINHPSLRLFALAGAAALSLGLATPAVLAQTMYSLGATGTSGTTGADSPPSVNRGANGAPGGAGNAGTSALDLSGDDIITGGNYVGGAGGAGGRGGQGGAGLPGFNIPPFITVPPGNGGNGGAGGRGAMGSAAITAESGATVSITGGVFSFGFGGVGGAGGAGGARGGTGASNGMTGLQGSLGANGFTLLDNGGTITLFGTFDGGPQTLTIGMGSVMGTLANQTGAQIFTYDITAGSIVLADSPAPEPSTWAMLLGGVGLFVGMRYARRAHRA